MPRSLFDIARAHVEFEHSTPTGPIAAGLCAMSAAGFCAALLAVAAGYPFQDVLSAAAIAGAVGFVMPYFYLRGEKRRHSQMILDEYRRLDQATKPHPGWQNDSSDPPSD